MRTKSNGVRIAVGLIAVAGFLSVATLAYAAGTGLGPDRGIEDAHRALIHRQRRCTPGAFERSQTARMWALATL
jgi:hypothetical protein